MKIVIRKAMGVAPWLLAAVWTAMFAWPLAAPIQAAGNDQTKMGLELTVYNQDLALVKDRRMVNLPGGVDTVSFTEVASGIDPTSVRFRSLTDPGVKVLEQNYEYDVINDAQLLEKFLGQKIKLTTVKGETIEGFLLSGGNNLILSAKADGGEVRIVKAAQIQSVQFPELPGGLVIRPTLVWLLSNPAKSGPQQVEVTYLTGGLSWKADYVATINQTDDRLDLTGWVTLDNRSGAEYREARLKLVAGEINRAPEADREQALRFMQAKAPLAADQRGFQEESFFEYHLYALGRPATLKNNQMKQVELLTASGIPARKLFIYEGSRDPRKVKVMLEVTNGQEQKLGIPLPKGRIRVQKADGDGSLQLIGEDRIDHIAKDEKVRVNLGNAFDIAGERIQTGVKETGSKTREESYQITLRNHKQEAVTVTAVEYPGAWNEWQIVKNDHPFVKTEAGKIEFTVKLPPDGQATINYTIRYKW